MKRSEALADIKHCGYINDTGKAAVITAQKGIGKAASRKAFLDGRKLADRGDPCDCPKCAGKNKKG
ncbi:MAG: hypothetical protein LBQ89_07870 [Treponema sp.]|jgi:uncharacterized Zn-binding protein involved in type VI secretion|nr:hypothetical protein [Treponema sp.]